jgi:acetolactate synthase I/II/III large subunit
MNHVLESGHIDLIPIDAAIAAAAQLINNAKRPYVLYGQGVILANAEAELKAFLDKSGIPAASTLLGSGALSQDHPCYVGNLVCMVIMRQIS